jgi:DNA primase
VVASIKNQGLRDRYAIRLIGMVGIATQTEEQAVIRRVRALARSSQARARTAASTTGRQPQSRSQPQSQAAPRNAPGGPRLDLRSPAHRVERELLKLALQYPQLVSPAFDAYGEDEFTGAPYAVVRRAIADAGGVAAADDEYLPRVRDTAPDDTVRALVTELAVEPPITRRAVDALYAGEQLVAVRLQAVDRRIAEVRANLARLGPRADAAAVAAVQHELWALQQYGQRLRVQGAAGL